MSEDMAYLNGRTFDKHVEERTLRVGIVGLGYTGLPLALSFADTGVSVVGYDINDEKIDFLRAGKSYLIEIPDKAVAAASGLLTPTTEAEDLRGVHALVICVPTPLTSNGEPDLRYVDAALDVVQSVLEPGSLVVVQSTVPPGTTAAGARRLAAGSGLELGSELFVAMAPERIDPGNKNGWTVANTPRLVGGMTAECTRRAVALFSMVCEQVVPVSTSETAETAKVFENTFRLVNIALTYELSEICSGLNISPIDVIDAAATKPFGFMSHRPGPGIGGECIPVDPMFFVDLGDRAGMRLPLINSAYLHVQNRPIEVVERLARVSKERGFDLADSTVLLAGVSYKPGIADTRNAPALGVTRELWLRGAEVSYADPYVEALEVDGRQVPRVEWNELSVAEHDHIVLLTPHQQLVESPVWSAAHSVLDTWHLLDRDERVAVL